MWSTRLLTVPSIMRIFPDLSIQRICDLKYPSLKLFTCSTCSMIAFKQILNVEIFKDCKTLNDWSSVGQNFCIFHYLTRSFLLDSHPKMKLLVLFSLLALAMTVTAAPKGACCGSDIVVSQHRNLFTPPLKGCPSKTTFVCRLASVTHNYLPFWNENPVFETTKSCICQLSTIFESIGSFS